MWQLFQSCRSQNPLSHPAPLFVPGSQASAISTKSLAKSLVNWEATLPQFIREAAYSHICPGPGKANQISISSGVSLGILFRANKMQLSIDDDKCTLFRKNDRTWQEIEAQETEEKAAFIASEMKNVKTMVTSLDSKLNTMSEGMSEKLDGIVQVVQAISLPPLPPPTSTPQLSEQQEDRSTDARLNRSSTTTSKRMKVLEKLGLAKK